MSKSKKKQPFDPDNITPEDQLKLEIAEELGLKEQVLQQGWKSLSSKETGRIGGLMTKKKRQLRETALQTEES